MGISQSSIKSIFSFGQRNVHFLHIGKNAGTQIWGISNQINNRSRSVRIIKHDHDVSLKHLRETDEYFFSIRDPITRFKSGFYSRKRKGQPATFVEWTRHDALAFGSFEHANDLAESLFESGRTGEVAWAAMKSLRHSSQNQSDWFDCRGNFLSVQPPIWIIRQERFEDDLKQFLSRLNLELGIEDIKIVDGDVASHKNNYELTPPISEKAAEKLRKWYAQDFEFYRLCDNWIEANQR